jgi:basic membrane protein A and related proteins
MSGKLRGVFSLVSVAVLAAACSSSASPSPTTAPPSATPSAVTSASASASESASASASTSAAPNSSLKIGVVTDVGSITDKNFNQYSYEGAKAAAAALGATVNYVVPADASDYTKDIQGFVDGSYNVIVTVGFNLGTATITAAKANPNIWFIAVDVAPCVTADGAPDSTFACKGDAATLLPKLIGIQFQEDQAGYLAGMVAAAVSKTGVIGTIGGVNNNPAVVKYMQGFQLGAVAYKASTQVKTAFFSTGDLKKAYGDSTWGKTFGAQFITQQKVDVLFPVAGGTGNAALDAACTAGITAIGVDVDQFLSYPSADKCIVTSAEKHLSNAVQQTIAAIAAGSAKGGISKFDATNGGVGYSAFHNTTITLPSDLQGKLDAALAAMKAGTLTTCPTKCGTWTGQ